MLNLAGHEECDKFIRKELGEAGIKTQELDQQDIGEVPYYVYGEIGEIRFERAWTYWVVKGKVPMNIAENLYADPVGKVDVQIGRAHV